MDRRRLLTMLAAGTAATLLGAREASADFPFDSGSSGIVPQIPGLPQVTPDFGPKTPIGPGTISALPGDGNHMALTIDDGASSETIGGFIDFARNTGARLTFFVTAYYPGWLEHRDALRPLVDSGQIQLGNHTWDHPDLTRLPGGAIADQLNRCKDFLWNQYGTDGTPYYRPPFGYHNGSVDAVAADCGYTVPTMWYGTLNDTNKVINEGMLLDAARQWFRAQSIVIGHANRPTVTHLYDQFTDIIRERNLQLVTLNDVLIPPR
ncbi:polysaccharide deacetylase family protein [Nocardia yunnanensis]|uniref:Polysaccharide deacetylase family protein n=1 Tax=Nocardia yunnanensis TaxID=2382165 RepID=A0A386ZF49_9NOCA|nr:polysaccharide deacetylase family protein [Nocardia yunnanensis]AYF76037.1 polysaccharide deacetylase family protein [Nocardia yunnanensis]